MFFCAAASWVMTVMPCSIALPSTGSSASGDIGTTASALTPCAIMSSSNATCCCGSACAGPTRKASAPVSAANFLTPSSMRLNHWMPAIFTTVAIFGLSCAASGVASIAAAAAAPKTSLNPGFIEILPLVPRLDGVVLPRHIATSPRARATENIPVGHHSAPATM